MQQRQSSYFDGHSASDRIHHFHYLHVSDDMPFLSNTHIDINASVQTMYRYTNTIFTTPTPTKSTCSTPTAARLAAQAVSTGISGSLVLSKVAPSATAAVPTLAARAIDSARCAQCPPLKDGIKSACSCFFPPGPQQTQTVNGTTFATATTTVTSTTYTYAVRTRTVARKWLSSLSASPLDQEQFKLSAALSVILHPLFPVSVFYSP